MIPKNFLEMSHLLLYNISIRKRCFILKKNKELALNLLKQKVNGEINLTFKDIAFQSGYERKQINRFYNQIEKEDGFLTLFI